MQLPPKAREAFEAIDLGGSGVSEFAAERGWARKTAEKWLTFARKSV